MSQSLNVHVRVNDADTGQPTPVRIRIAGPNGEYFPPLGRSAEFPVGRNEDVGGHVYLNQKRYAYIDGTCEVTLPTGVLLDIESWKGPAYLPVQETTVLGEGQLTLRYSMRRWTDERWTRLTSTDSRCHFLTPHAAKLEAAAEGLDLVNLLATVQDYPSPDGHMYRVVPNIAAFSGQSAALEGVYVNTFNVHPVLGRLGLLHSHRAVYPLTFGYIDETDDWSLADWADQCHRKKGLVVWCDAYRPEAGFPGGEALVNAILGKIDAIEIDAHDRGSSFLPLWYRLLNVGVQLPLVGGSGKDSNCIALGGVRTLTPAENSRTYGDWVNTVRSGITVVTNGPFVRLSVAGLPWISGITRDASRPVHLLAEAASIVPFEKLELVANGTVVASAKPTIDNSHMANVWTATIEVEHPLHEGGWAAARCWGTAKASLYPHTPVFAHTSPVFVLASGRAGPRLSEAAAALRREIEAIQHWIETEGRFTIPRRKELLLANCAAALGRL